MSNLFLFEKKGRKRSRGSAKVVVGQTTIGIPKSLIEDRLGLSDDVYCTIGYNENRDLCLFVSEEDDQYFPKLQKNATKSVSYIQIPRANREAIASLRGKYKPTVVLKKEGLYSILLENV